MGDSSASYIRTVHHLIEECLLFHMTKEESMEALSKHANIQPIVTSTVWKELEKENKDFFETYEKSVVDGKPATTSDHKTTRQRIQKMLSDSSKRHP